MLIVSLFQTINAKINAQLIRMRALLRRKSSEQFENVVTYGGQKLAEAAAVVSFFRLVRAGDAGKAQAIIVIRA
jgi:hypothetical protein